MRKSIELRDKRAGLIKKARAIFDEADGENRELHAGEESRYDRLEKEIRAIDKDIDRLESLEAQERGLTEPISGQRPPRNTPDPPEWDEGIPFDGSSLRSRPAWESQYRSMNWDDETRAVRTPAADMESLQFLKAIISNDQAMLREIVERSHNQVEHRADLAVGIGAAGTGGGVVPVGFSNAIHLIMARAARLRRFCTVIPGGEFAQKVPVQTTRTVAAVHTEASDMEVGVTEPVFGSVTPEAVKLGAIIKFSRELIDDSPLALLNLVTQEIGEAIGTLEDLSILDGSVFTDSIFADVATGTATWTDATETLATLTTKYYELPSVSRARSVWLINEATAAVLTAITATDGRPMLQEFNPPPRTIDDVGGQVSSLLGRPVLVFPTGATGVPANEGFFGDLTGYSIYMRENLRVERSDAAYFETDQVGLRVSRRMDGVISQSARMLRFA